jgi:hypothetical protein
MATRLCSKRTTLGISSSQSFFCPFFARAHHLALSMWPALLTTQRAPMLAFQMTASRTGRCFRLPNCLHRFLASRNTGIMASQSSLKFSMRQNWQSEKHPMISWRSRSVLASRIHLFPKEVTNRSRSAKDSRASYQVVKLHAHTQPIRARL